MRDINQIYNDPTEIQYVLNRFFATELVDREVLIVTNVQCSSLSCDFKCIPFSSFIISSFPSFLRETPSSPMWTQI